MQPEGRSGAFPDMAWGTLLHPKGAGQRWTVFQPALLPEKRSAMSGLLKSRYGAATVRDPSWEALIGRNRAWCRRCTKGAGLNETRVEIYTERKFQSWLIRVVQTGPPATQPPLKSRRPMICVLFPCTDRGLQPLARFWRLQGLWVGVKSHVTRTSS